VSEKKKPPLSRRDFLFGGLRRLRGDDRPEAPALAAATQGVAPDAAKQAKDAFVRGNLAYASARYEAAIPEYRECVRLFPAHLEARKRLGYCLYRTGQFVQARIEFERVLREAKADNFSSLYLGLTFASMGRADKAAAAWRQYRNTDEVRIMRELNLQIALLESPEKPDLADVVAEVEQTILQRKEELLAAQADAQG
jgi:tetratricopeptide (TPR) repeat protein